MNKEKRLQVLQRLVAYANKEIHYGVDFGSMTGEGTPSGMCVTSDEVGKMIFIRAGKGLNGQIVSLIHEIAHGENRNDNLYYVGRIGNALEEWECESVAFFVSELLGIDRRERIMAHIVGYVGVPVPCTNNRVKTLTSKIYTYLNL
jgi:hypothetical protein